MRKLLGVLAALAVLGCFCWMAWDDYSRIAAAELGGESVRVHSLVHLLYNLGGKRLVLVGISALGILPALGAYVGIVRSGRQRQPRLMDLPTPAAVRKPRPVTSSAPPPLQRPIELVRPPSSSEPRPDEPTLLS